MIKRMSTRILCAAVLILATTAIGAQQLPKAQPTVEQAIVRLNTQLKGCRVEPFAVELFDVGSNQPLQPLPGNRTEAFFTVSRCTKSGSRAKVGFIGLYSGREVQIPPYENISDHPGHVARYNRNHRFKDEQGRELEARPWCCTPNRLASDKFEKYHEIMENARERVLLFSRQELISVYGQTTRHCAPFHEPTVVLGPDGETPLWTRLFAVKQDEPIPQVHCAANGEALTFDGAEAGSLLEGNRLAVGVGRSTLIVLDYRSGSILTRLPADVRAPRMEEILKFRDEFRKTQTCSNTDRKSSQVATAQISECQIALQKRYEAAIVNHFFKD